MMHPCDHETLLAAAKAKYGDDAEISAPYWVDHEILRVGLSFANGNGSCGVNFYWKEGRNFSMRILISNDEGTVLDQLDSTEKLDFGGEKFGPPTMEEFIDLVSEAIKFEWLRLERLANQGFVGEVEG